MVILYFGDIFGKPGRRAISAVIGDLIATHQPNFVIGNVENLAGGRGANRKTLNELIELGFNAFTSGNHIWDNKEIYQWIDTEPKLIRPANYPNHPLYPCPGKGYRLIRSSREELLVINLLGRVFMDAVDCPFTCIDKILDEHKDKKHILVDMHADATSEKAAMGWHLDGRVSAVVGSHSHVQTADERILPSGTAFITDVGMTGAWDSVIGLSRAEGVKRFLVKRPIPPQNAKENPGVSCVVITLSLNGQAKSIERIRKNVSLTGFESESNLE